MSDEVENGMVVKKFQRAIHSSNIDEIAQLVKRLLAEQAWRRFVFPNMVQTERNPSLGQFLTAEPLQGCGFKDLGNVEALIKKACDPDLYAEWRNAITMVQGAHHDIVMKKAEQGNSLPYTLARLRRERSDLFERVKMKELSANAAAIEAGFRKKLTPFEQVLKLLSKLTKSERRRLRQQLDKE